MRTVTVIGGGLAGSEAAWQIAQQGLPVDLYEMRPDVQTGAHRTGFFAELVCSNSLGSSIPDRASGLLMEELRMLGSILLTCAEQAKVPAGGALAVNRTLFSATVTEKLENHPLIRIHREEVKAIPAGNSVLASGPLTSSSLAKALQALTGEENLAFFDALAPIVSADSINWDIAFKASRYDRGTLEEGDYVNCPLSQIEYTQFVEALLQAETIPLKSFEEEIKEGVRAGMHGFFEGCLPVEVIARRGFDSLAYGPMRPVGLTDPRTGRWPYAVVQLRREDRAGSSFNLVGFQTNLRFSEQDRVLRKIPGLERAEFERYGQMHRNTFLNAPVLLKTDLSMRLRPSLFVAGQLAGVEGYLGSIATGLLAGQNAARTGKGVPQLILPETTMLGSILRAITEAEPERFQPVKANFGIVPALTDDIRRGKRDRARAYSERALSDLKVCLDRDVAHRHNV
ncbi:MAG: methylenetetrahydrofolate--tRNA-(uracil(54)-C(5))-methyltransferase (FADH(2)-oxidizing) TrmFO [Anaerolineales bacterium]|nr:methylenetetrahydrofolate--tRNA-(uracil(54)-C(5))-methyltransferase (FADH(2)-oxidizing) TrmFO [Anaerolineales bacterium]